MRVVVRVVVDEEEATARVESDRIGWDRQRTTTTISSQQRWCRRRHL